MGTCNENGEALANFLAIHVFFLPATQLSITQDYVDRLAQGSEHTIRFI